MIATLPIALEQDVSTIENSLDIFFLQQQLLLQMILVSVQLVIGGCTIDTQDTVNNIVDKDPELVLQLGDTSYDKDSEDCWFSNCRSHRRKDENCYR